LLTALSEDAVLRRQAPECWPPETLPPSDPALSRLLEQLRVTPPPEALATDDGAEAQDTALGFLGPPAHPGDLGTLGPYRILKELGRGGMGIVFLAYDPSLQRTVALKVLPPERADARARARFVREAQAAAGIEHDHVVPVHVVANPADGPLYLVMPYVEGLTLRERIKTEGRLDPREAARICHNWPRVWRLPTAPAWSTATSSRATSCSNPPFPPLHKGGKGGVGPRSWISAWCG
jgi:hypothetical protein